MNKTIFGYRSILIDIIFCIILPIILITLGDTILIIFSGFLLIVGLVQLLLIFTIYQIKNDSLVISNIIKTRKKEIKLSSIKSVSADPHPEYIDVGSTPYTLKLTLDNGEEIYESLSSKKEVEKLKDIIQKIIQKK